MIFPDECSIPLMLLEGTCIVRGEDGLYVLVHGRRQAGPFARKEDAAWEALRIIVEGMQPPQRKLYEEAAEALGNDDEPWRFIHIAEGVRSGASRNLVMRFADPYARNLFNEREEP